MASTKIEWSDAVWNPVAGCQYASEGCRFCYAATMTRRLEAMGKPDYAGLTTKKHFNGVVQTLPHKLDAPLHWRKPRMVFVNSMSDLFHKDVPFEFIHKVYVIMEGTRRHTYQVLTKRPERRAEFYQWERDRASDEVDYVNLPLPNVWEGTSVENQAAADERIPHLLRCPAAVRFLSVEPMLGPVDLSAWTDKCSYYCDHGDQYPAGHRPERSQLDWIIVGGESGPKARPCNVAWIRDIIAQCRAASVGCFVKQLGAKIVVANDSCSEWPNEGDGWIFDDDVPVYYQGEPMEIWLHDKKGGDPAEWPEDLRVREWPSVAAQTTE